MDRHKWKAPTATTRAPLRYTTTRQADVVEDEEPGTGALQQLSYPASLRQPIAALRQLQRTYGNAWVQRTVEGAGRVQAGDQREQGFFSRIFDRLRYGTGPISDANVRAVMRQAWTDSQAASAANRHEEGGYIVRRADGSLGVARWPRGAGASITPPARSADGRFNGEEVLGEFHTHPNPPVDESGQAWVQGPHPGDTNAIAAEGYPGDSYIISRDSVYRVRNDGTSTRVGGRRALLGD